MLGRCIFALKLLKFSECFADGPDAIPNGRVKNEDAQAAESARLQLFFPLEFKFRVAVLKRV